MAEINIIDDLKGYSTKCVETSFNLLKSILPNPPLAKGGSRFALEHKFYRNAQSGHSPLLAGEMSTDRGVIVIKNVCFPLIMSNNHLRLFKIEILPITYSRKFLRNPWFSFPALLPDGAMARINL